MFCLFSTISNGLMKQDISQQILSRRKSSKSHSGTRIYAKLMAVAASSRSRKPSLTRGAFSNYTYLNSTSKDWNYLSGPLLWPISSPQTFVSILDNFGGNMIIWSINQSINALFARKQLRLNWNTESYVAVFYIGTECSSNILYYYTGSLILIWLFYAIHTVKLVWATL